MPTPSADAPLALTTCRSHDEPEFARDASKFAPVGNAHVMPAASDIAPCEFISVTAVGASLDASTGDSSINVTGAAEGVARDVSHLTTTTIFRGFSE